MCTIVQFKHAATQQARESDSGGEGGQKDMEGHLGQSHISPPPPWFLFEISMGCFLLGG